MKVYHEQMNQTVIESFEFDDMAMVETYNFSYFSSFMSLLSLFWAKDPNFNQSRVRNSALSLLIG